MVEEQLNATIICQFDELSLTWLDCLQIDSEDFILFSEINQILLKLFFIPISLTFMQFMYLVALSLISEKWVVNNLKWSQTQLIKVTR